MSLAPQLNDFSGKWIVERKIDDRLSGTTGIFAGTASFRPVPTGLAYHEEGQLILGTAAPLTATRSYLWRQSAGRIFVDHADGRSFHDFDPSDPRAHHLCAPDDYRVSYDFSRWPDWLAEWQVSGPRKDYLSRSRYRRAFAAG